MKKFKSLFISGLFFCLGLICGCGGDAKFSQAKKLEAKGEYQKAWEFYQEFAAKNPRHAAAAEALFRAGWLAQKQLGDCVAARAFYDSVLQNYPQSGSWAAQSAYYRNNCPDYFPVLNGFRWVEGDSDTNGKNARIEIVCRVQPNKDNKDTLAVITKTYFAGETKFKGVDFTYKKTDLEVMEFASKTDPRFKTILMWPLLAGTKWVTKHDNKTFRYEIVAADKEIKVQAGTFANCIQVRSTIDGFPGATNEYYAPDIGRVLVTISTSEGERRNTELLSFTLPKDTEPKPSEEKPS